MTEIDEEVSPGHAARILGVNPKTVSRWCDEGLIPCTVLPSGHRRLLRSDVLGFGATRLAAAS